VQTMPPTTTGCRWYGRCLPSIPQHVPGD
jgi:hypothetical protein